MIYGPMICPRCKEVLLDIDSDREDLRLRARLWDKHKDLCPKRPDTGPEVDEDGLTDPLREALNL